MSITKTCSLNDCEKKHYGHGMCSMHYARWYKYKSPDVVVREQHRMIKTPEYRCWAGMKTRCYDKKCRAYPKYGGRGIKMCPRWKNSFLAFYKDMGGKPSKEYSLDRIDNDGNYKSSNCRWATRLQQGHNRSSTLWFTIDGRTQTLKEWCIEYGRDYKSMHHRIKRLKWTAERALTKPTQRR